VKYSVVTLKKLQLSVMYLSHCLLGGKLSSSDVEIKADILFTCNYMHELFKIHCLVQANRLKTIVILLHRSVQ